MSDNEKRALFTIARIKEIDSPEGQLKLMTHFNEINLCFCEWETEFQGDPYLNDIYNCHKKIVEVYQNIIINVLKHFCFETYNCSIDFALNNNDLDILLIKLEHYLGGKTYPNQFCSDVRDYLYLLAERLNKRFVFDESALINLIEASMGKNIVTEQGMFKDKIILATNKGYRYKESQDKDRFTRDGSKIEEIKDSDRVIISSYPLGNQFRNSSNNDLTKVMLALFENLNLCIETYCKMYYSSKNEVNTSARLASGNTFDFKFVINDTNIPHLLGIPRGDNLSQKTINMLNIINNGSKQLNRNSSALDVLNFILSNQKTLIAMNGLYEENGKFYQFLNWEKVILKTTAFMRGDFFKTCFCLARISDNKYLVDEKYKGGYVTVSTSEYHKPLRESKSSGAILNELLSGQRQKKDYIFRGIKTDGKGQNVVYTLLTGKAETIRVGKDDELFRSLQKYRFILNDSDGARATGSGTVGSGSSGGGTPSGGGHKFSQLDEETCDYLMASIIQEIENEKYIKKFSPEEQMQLAEDIHSDFGLKPQISKDAIVTLQNDYGIGPQSYEESLGGRKK